MTVRLSGDYDEVVGENKEQFLKECSNQYPNVECYDVVPGSIIVTLGGKKADVEAAVTLIEDEGMDLPSFPAMSTEQAFTEQTSSESSSATLIIILVVVVVVVVCLAGAYCAYTMKQQDELKKKKRTEDMEMMAAEAGNEKLDAETADPQPQDVDNHEPSDSSGRREDSEVKGNSAPHWIPTEQRGQYTGMDI